LDRHAVSGEVSLGGTPLDVGSIEFRPTGGGKDAISGGAVISEGRYEIDEERGLPPGEYQVRIHSGDPAGNAPNLDEPPGLIPTVLERVPARYNSQTTLSAKVTPEGPNEFNFKLESK
jgi:hypothetical protein